MEWERERSTGLPSTWPDLVHMPRMDSLSHSSGTNDGEMMHARGAPLTEGLYRTWFSMGFSCPAFPYQADASTDRRDLWKAIGPLCETEGDCGVGLGWLPPFHPIPYPT